jgi:hypothetical protein
VVVIRAVTFIGMVFWPFPHTGTARLDAFVVCYRSRFRMYLWIKAHVMHSPATAAGSLASTSLIAWNAGPATAGVSH